MQSGKAPAALASMMPVGVLFGVGRTRSRGGLFRAALWSPGRSTHLVGRPVLEMSPKYSDEVTAQILQLQPISPILLHLTMADSNPSEYMPNTSNTLIDGGKVPRQDNNYQLDAVIYSLVLDEY